MDHGQAHVQENDIRMHHDNDFSNNPQWVEMNGYQASQQSPMHEYNGYQFHSPQLSLDSQFNRMHSPSHTSLPQLQPLSTAPWPTSMTSSSSTFATPSIIPTAPATARVPTTVSSHTTHTTSAPRKTLTDADRRRMCIYHEENPTVKQTEIGGKSTHGSGSENTIILVHCTNRDNSIIWSRKKV
jgi:hypothetical protein